ncbi:MAG: hypothetical protein GWO02_01930, partial [Gammaproteobacteria bacterium]|nr:hypothetical protein [Gammaproteobacteria bacterium]
GHLLLPDEKIALDIWYAKRGNVVLDVWILLKSLRVILTGDRRKEDVIAQAQAELDDLVVELHKEDWRLLRGRRPPR